MTKTTSTSPLRKRDCVPLPKC